MGDTEKKQFHVLNLDCAACGAKIEKELNKIDGVEDAVLDFVGSTLHIRVRNGVPVEDLVRRIDASVKLIPENERMQGEIVPESNRFRREVVLLSASAILFSLLITFEQDLHSAGWEAWEYPLVFSAYLLSGWNVLAAAFRTIKRGDVFDENVLMAIATGSAIAIHALSEAVGVMIFYKIGEILQERAVSRSRHAISALLDARPDQAMLLTLTGYQTVSPDKVAVGDTIIVKPGEKIPLDGTVLSGESQLDTSPLTGESLPVSAREGTSVMAGAINLSGALSVQVTRLFRESAIVRILDLVRNAASKKAHTEKFITTFARFYTPMVVVGALAIAFIPPLLYPEASVKAWIYRALVLLVISCPCALMISIPLGYFGGIGRASRAGILVKGSNFIDALAQLDTVVFDKTGTLTQGVFEVESIVAANNHQTDELLEFAAAAEYHSTHPIGASITHAYTAQGRTINATMVTNHQTFAGRGVIANYKNRKILVGNEVLLHDEGIVYDRCPMDGTLVYLAVDGSYAGYILIGDRLKPQSPSAVASLRKSGVDRLVMLTGDSHCAAEQVSTALHLDEFHACLLPEEKVQYLEKLLKNNGRKGKVAFVGDGINDAPVLARADVGVAMGALGSDAAIETADVVLMTDSPAKLSEAIAIARRTRRIVWQNIILALSVKVIFISFGAFGMATMWEAVFADMGTAVIAVINATRALGKYRHEDTFNTFH